MKMMLLSQLRTVLVITFYCSMIVISSKLNITIHYPESQLNLTYIKDINKIFNLNIYTCMENHVVDDEFTFGTSECPGGEFFYLPSYVIETEDKIGSNMWRKSFDMGTKYTGQVFFTIANSVSYVGGSIATSVPACLHAPEVETSCFQIGLPW